VEFWLTELQGTGEESTTTSTEAEARVSASVLGSSSGPTMTSTNAVPTSSGTSSSTMMTASGMGAWKMGSLPEGRGVPQEGIGDGEFMMQGFLLSSEEESSNQSGYFVPSLVYLPVREKVSQSIRVSFSLTPTS